MRGCTLRRIDFMKLVSFSGIDGAGKSTQIDSLRNYLEERGLKSKLYTFWDDVVALRSLREDISHTVFKGDRGVGSPEDPIHRRDKNVRSWYVTLLRFFLYALDGASLRIAAARIERTTDVVIFDRYIYDELANLPMQRPAVRLYTRLLLRVVPKPDLAFLVDADPEAASTRKPEYPLEFVHHNRNSYLLVSQLAGMTVLPARTVEETAESIRKLVDEKWLRGRGASREVKLRNADANFS